MTVTSASSLLAEASACRWSQLAFAKRWNELRASKTAQDAELLNAFWTVAVTNPPRSGGSSPSSFDDDLSFLDSFDLEIDKDLVASFVYYSVASGQLSPEAVWHFISSRGGLTKHDHGKLQIEILGDLLKSTVISLLSLSHESQNSNNSTTNTDSPTANGGISVDTTSVAKFKLLIEIKTNMVTSICDFLSTHWDFNNQLTCLRLSKWLDVASIFEKSGPLKVYCQFSTPRATVVVDSWRRLQQLSLSMAALDRSAIAIKENLITMSHRWITRSKLPPFTAYQSPSKSNSTSVAPVTDGTADPDFCSLFCGAVDYLYALEFGSNVNRFSSSEFLIPLLRSLALSMTLFVAPSNSENAVTQQLTARYVPLLGHVATSLAIPSGNLFELIEHSAKTVAQQQPPQQPSKKFAATFIDTRPSYLMRVFMSCRLSSLAKSLGINNYNGQFVAELITMAGRDISRAEFEEFVSRELLKNVHIAPFLCRTEATRLHLILSERASKEDNHLALGVLAAVELFRCYLVSGPGVEKPNDGIPSEGAVGAFLENIINKRIKNFAHLLNTTDDDAGCDHHQDDNDGHLPDLDTFMSTLPDSLAESVGIGLETASRLLFLLGKADSNRLVTIVRRLVFANPTLAFILWLLVDEKLRRRQIVCGKRNQSDSPAAKKSRRNEGDGNVMDFLLTVIEALKTNINTLKPPFSSVYSLLLVLSSQVRSLATYNRTILPNSSSITPALKQPGILNHYLVIREVALPEGVFKSGDATAASLGAVFHRILVSSSSGGNGVDTSEGYHNFLSFALPLVAGLDAETLRYLFRRWFASEDGFLASSLLCGTSPGMQLSYIVAAQMWNFSFFLILMTQTSSSMSNEDIKQTLGRFFNDWHKGAFINGKNSERFRFVAVEMFFAELMFFSNVNVCRLVAGSLPSEFILNFVTSTTPAGPKSNPSLDAALSAVATTPTTTTAGAGFSSVLTSSACRLLQLKRRVLGRLFALDESNRFDEDFCIRAVCSLSPFESL